MNTKPNYLSAEEAQQAQLARSAAQRAPVGINLYHFSANGLDFGYWMGVDQDDAQERFASDAGYLSWQDMVNQAEEFGGNNVEVRLVQLPGAE